MERIISHAPVGVNSSDVAGNALDLRVGGLYFGALIIEFVGSYRSGQTGQTVNLLAYAFGGSNPPLPTKT